MFKNKRPLLQKQEIAGSGGARVRVPRKPPMEESALDSTERTRRALNRLNKATNTKLFTAAKNGWLWDVNNLLGAGADLNAINNKGQSVLDLARKSGNASLTRFLERKGAKSAKELN